MDRVTVDSITKRFGSHLVFENISLELKMGESCCLWGPNGIGKSTLLKTVAGLIRPTKGSVTFIDGEKKLQPALARNSLGMAAPDLLLYDELTPAENLDFLAGCRGVQRYPDWENELCERLFPDGLRQSPMANFSSGMRRKIFLIASMVHRPKVLLLDEPTSHFDERGKKETGAILSELKKDIILIIASNDAQEREWCDSTYELS